MKTPSSVVFPHEFDQATLNRINELREERVQLARMMLDNLSGTAEELRARGLLDEDGGPEDIKGLEALLHERIERFTERLKRPDVVYDDELSLYVDLLAEGDQIQ